MNLKITSELGKKIIEQIITYTEYDVNIMDLNGVIVASTDTQRIHGIHSGAVHVIETGNSLTLTSNDINKYTGTKPGSNLPITHQRELMGVVGVSGNPDEVGQVSSLIKAFVEVILDQIHMQQQTYYMERQWNFWLQKLLHPKGFDQDELTREAKYSFKIDTASDWKVILLQGDNLQKVLDHVREEINNMSIKPLCIQPFHDDELITVVPAQFERVSSLLKQLNTLFPNTFRCGIGEVENGVAGIRASYEQAKQALEFEKSNSISYSADWKVKRLITSIPESEYKRICLRYEKELNKLGAEYLKTVDTFLRNNLSVKKTAHELHIHRNTLIYRMDQIKLKTNLSLRTSEDIVLIKIIRDWRS